MVKIQNQQETNPDGGTGTMLLMGHHHIMIDLAEECVSEHDGTPQVKVKVTCLASDDPSQVGRDRTEYLKLVGSLANMIWNLIIAVGLRTKEQWKIVNTCLKEGTEIPKDENGRDLDDLPIEDVIGRQCLCLVEDKSFVAEKDSAVGKFKKGDRVPKSEIGFNWYPLIPYEKNREFDKYVIDREHATDEVIAFQYPGYDPNAAAVQGPAPGTPAGAPANKPTPASKAPASAPAANGARKSYAGI